MTSCTGTFVLLGTGTSSGIPVVGCNCPVCHSTDRRNQRSRCSALVLFGQSALLIDTATDFRQQALREKIERIDAVLYTHTHADHVHGIDDLHPYCLRHGGPIPIYASAESVALIRRNFSYIFDAGLDPGYRPELETIVITAPVDRFGLHIIPIPLIHGTGTALGYRIGDVAYLTDCSAIPATSLALLGGLETLVLDALRFRPHATHFNIAQALAVAAQIGARRTLLTHLSHEVDHLRHSADLPAGVEFAWDGQRFNFSSTLSS